MIKSCTEIYLIRGLWDRLAMERDELWKPGSDIKISFIGGTELQRLKTVENMSVWLDYADLNFVFAMDDEFVGEIRVAFNEGDGSWSYVGKQALLADRDKPTMNFGWLDEGTDDVEWRRTVLHETGHMLGAIHEHQSPAAGIKWNKKFMYRYYWENHRWSKHMVDVNIFEKYNKGITNTEFDPESIMLYPIPPEFTRDGFSVGWNTELSEKDKQFMGEMYKT